MDDELKLRHQVCFALYAASRAVTARYRPLLDGLGLTYPQYAVLLVLWEHGDTTIKDLGSALMLDSGTLSPLRGRSLGDVEVLEDAYVLCEDGLVSAVGRMRELQELGGDIEGLDARGMCAIPGLVDCHTHACFGGDRVEEFSLRAAGASYEELHAAGGGILSTVRATREAGRVGLREARSSGAM